MADEVVRRKYPKSEDTKEKILDAAVDLFHSYGFARTSTRQLVNRADMSSSAIYNHFPNKDHILFTIINGAGEKTLTTLRNIIERYDDPEECLKKMISTMLALFKIGFMRKEIAIFIDELYQLPEDMREICNKQHREIFDLFEGRVKELKRRNRAHAIEDRVATFGIIGAILWVYHWFRDSGSLSIEEVSDELIKLLFDGLVKGNEPHNPLPKDEVKGGLSDE